MFDGVTTTTDKGDIHVHWSDTVASPSYRLVVSTSDSTLHDPIVCTELQSGTWHLGEFVCLQDPILLMGIWLMGATWIVVRSSMLAHNLWLRVESRRKRPSLKQVEEGGSSHTLRCTRWRAMFHATWILGRGVFTILDVCGCINSLTCSDHSQWGCFILRTPPPYVSLPSPSVTYKNIDLTSYIIMAC